MSAAQQAAIRNSGITASSDGSGNVVPASRRADGSTRKERKVRPGFIPEEDRERYRPPRRQAVKPPAAGEAQEDVLAGSLAKLALNMAPERRQIKICGSAEDAAQVKEVAQGDSLDQERKGDAQPCKHSHREGAVQAKEADAPARQPPAHLKTKSATTRPTQPRPPWHEPPLPPPSAGKTPSEPAEEKNKRLVVMLTQRHEATRAERSATQRRLAKVELDSPARDSRPAKDVHQPTGDKAYSTGATSRQSQSTRPTEPHALTGISRDRASTNNKGLAARTAEAPSQASAEPSSQLSDIQKAFAPTRRTRLTPEESAALRAERWANSRYK